jgi:hypothetical protein
MKKIGESENFRSWPYRAETRRFTDNEINNGGIDLIKHPEKLELIHEATDLNGIRNILKFLNNFGGCYMTLGCASGLDEGFYYSYLEFTHRDYQVAMQENWPQDFENQWLTWVSLINENSPQLAQALIAGVVMDCRTFSFRDMPQQYLITIYARCLHESDHQILYAYIMDFFKTICLKITAQK